MPESKPVGANEEKLTGAGCVLTAVSFAVTLASAVYIVLRRDPDGRPLPRSVKFIFPLLVGAAIHGVGSAILRLFGLRVLSKPDAEKTDWPEV